MYYIYEKSSTYIMGKMDKQGLVRPDHRKSYATMSAAKAALTRMSKRYREAIPFSERVTATGNTANGTIGSVEINGNINVYGNVNDPEFRYAIAEAGYFHKSIEKSRTATNMMSGKQFVEPVNTPGYMSPSSESYWSM